MQHTKAQPDLNKLLTMKRSSSGMIISMQKKFGIVAKKVSGVLPRRSALSRSWGSTTSTEECSSSRHASLQCYDENEEEARSDFHNLMRGTTPRQDHRGVSFATHADVRKTLSWRDYSPEEVHATWNTGAEYMDLRRSWSNQIFKMEAGERLKDKKYCSRGLEGQTKCGLKARSKNRSDSLHAVLDQQETSHMRFAQLQQQDGYQCRPVILDDAAIAHAYHQVTSSCQLWASAVGLADARAAEEMHDILMDQSTSEEMLLASACAPSFSSSVTKKSSDRSGEDTTNNTSIHRPLKLTFAPRSVKRFFYCYY
jgi:hypothetical protein